ncbi:hypothetical protein [Nitratifractor salsuginis]|uniref:Uncharacterized protein n=1 Tax=Nitratifractor salsuginis (strain DSM 16511 / JCM 12458 / E9I37-1) TaxID=749222 RepID=E6X0D5_NITSE|nr:hypothetical protein [Nitratifractor salsuginis]ADV45724.1 hypothetical protein Nitsa_0454 [Nitratifractor salsuginis DSM 16511]
MKRTSQKIATAATLLLALGALANAADCRQGFMHDPCAHDGYSVVETEAFVKGPHNCMGVAHYYPWEVPAGYCRGAYEGKNTVRAQSPVARIGS